LHGKDGLVKLEDCQYKGKHTLVGAEQEWELKDVSTEKLFLNVLIKSARADYIKGRPVL
jgi:hypothetical protein